MSLTISSPESAKLTAQVRAAKTSAAASVEGWAAAGIGVRPGELSLALVSSDGRVCSSPWRHWGSLAELIEGTASERAFLPAQVSVTGWSDAASLGGEVLEALHTCDVSPRHVSPVQATVAWATHVTGRQHLRILIANRRAPSYCVLAHGGRPVNAVAVPAVGSVFEFFCRVAARQGWQGKEERIQWQSLLAPEVTAPDTDMHASHPLLVDVESCISRIADYTPEQRSAAAQRLLEQRVTLLFSRWFEEDPTLALCLMGDFSYNALLVRALERAGIPVHVPFAGGEHALALGAALAVAPPSGPNAQGTDNPFLGVSFTDQQIKDVIDNCHLRATYLTSSELVGRAVEELAANRIIGWFEGPAEIGPRALGARSILASPRMPYLAENLNVFVKNREPFRPFALSIAAESEETAGCSPNCRWLGSLAQPKERLARDFPELVLANGEMRLHLVQRTNPLFHQLLTKMTAHIGLPAVANTSFNSPGSPIVSTPREAIRTFFSHGIDTLFMGRWTLAK
jgi:hypothetical protein